MQSSKNNISCFTNLQNERLVLIFVWFLKFLTGQHVKGVMTDGVLLRHIASKCCTDSKTFDAKEDCSPRMALRERPSQVLLWVDSMATQLVFSDVWSQAVVVHVGSQTAVLQVQPCEAHHQHSGSVS